MATDQMAYGVIAVAEEYGLSVPGDIALVGFDDDAPSAHVRPSLTTIREPNYEMGQQGIKLLMSMLNAHGHDNWLTTSNEIPGGVIGNEIKSNNGKSIRIQLPTSLVVRESC